MSTSNLQLAAHAAIARATGKETEMTADEHKAEVLKYHPEAYAWKRENGRTWFIWVNRDESSDYLGVGDTEEKAWAQAAANAARMS